MVSEADRDKLIAFLHGELNPLDADRIAARLKTEEDLRLEYQALLAVDEQLGDLFVAPAQHDLNPDQVSRVLSAPKSQVTPLRRRPSFKAGGLALAASFVLAVMVWTKQQPSKPARFSQAPEPMDATAPSVPAKDVPAHKLQTPTAMKAEVSMAKSKSDDAQGTRLERARSAENAIDSQWFICAQVSDCVLADSGCELVAINKKFENEFIRFSKIQNSNCKSVTEDKGKFEATCRKSMCIRKGKSP